MKSMLGIDAVDVVEGKGILDEYCSGRRDQWQTFRLKYLPSLGLFVYESTLRTHPLRNWCRLPVIRGDRSLPTRVEEDSSARARQRLPPFFVERLTFASLAGLCGAGER